MPAIAKTRSAVLSWPTKGNLLKKNLPLTDNTYDKFGWKINRVTFRVASHAVVFREEVIYESPKNDYVGGYTKGNSISFPTKLVMGGVSQE